jgi:hypothetical protein
MARHMVVPRKMVKRFPVVGYVCVTCKHCNGSGILKKSYVKGNAGLEDGDVARNVLPCDRCGAQRTGITCKNCDGSGTC